MLAQAARYSDRPEAPQLGQIFAQKTLDTLAAEVDKGSSIPAIQGLLIFSARECACGRTSQGWLYSGMAFSMMRDMGIQIHPRKLSHLGGQFSAVELTLRQQIFWSCYTWDKTMSLCLGRNPALHDTIDLLSTDILLDGDDAENEIWKPKFANIYPLEIGVPQQKARTNSRFVAYCHLCIVSLPVSHRQMYSYSRFRSLMRSLRLSTRSLKLHKHISKTFSTQRWAS